MQQGQTELIWEQNNMLVRGIFKRMKSRAWVCFPLSQSLCGSVPICSSHSGSSSTLHLFCHFPAGSAVCHLGSYFVILRGKTAFCKFSFFLLNVTFLPFYQFFSCFVFLVLFQILIIVDNLFEQTLSGKFAN